MRKLVLFIALLAAFACSGATAGATIVYVKGQNVFTTDDNGKHRVRVASGKDLIPELTPDGKTVIYTNAAGSLFAVPAIGGAITPVGGTLKACSKCSVGFAPNGKNILLVGANGELFNVPLNGGSPILIPGKVSSSASFSPDSQSIVFDQESAADVTSYVVPAAGGVPVALPALYATSPVWGSAGIAVATLGVAGGKYQAQIVLLDTAGNLKRVLQRKSFKSLKALTRGQSQSPIAAVSNTVFTLEYGKKRRCTVRKVSALTGKVTGARSLKDCFDFTSFSISGKFVLSVDAKGKVQEIGFGHSKPKTLFKQGVDFAYVN